MIRTAHDNAFGTTLRQVCRRVANARWAWRLVQGAQAGGVALFAIIAQLKGLKPAGGTILCLHPHHRLG